MEQSAYREALARFCIVRDTIDPEAHPEAAWRAHMIRLQFYCDHTADEAKQLLIASETDPTIEEVAKYLR